jgi:hypothetical protein
MQPPLLGSQVRPVPHAALFGVCVQVPFEQASVVHAIKSSQSVSAQQAAQPTPAQHLPLAQPLGDEHLPLTQLTVEHGSLLGQSLSLAHCAVCTHVCVVELQVVPAAQTVVSGSCAHTPAAHESFVHSC